MTTSPPVSPHAMNVRPHPLAALAVLALLGGCPDPSTTGSQEPEPLATCLVRYWRSPPGDCAIMPECTGSPTGDMATACAASDCTSLVFTGYRSGGALVWGIGTWSASTRLFCSTGVSSGTWSVADAGHVTVQSGAAPAETVPAVCMGSTATVNDATVVALPADVGRALEARASVDVWTPCGY